MKWKETKFAHILWFLFACAILAYTNNVLVHVIDASERSSIMEDERDTLAIGFDHRRRKLMIEKCSNDEITLLHLMDSPATIVDQMRVNVSRPTVPSRRPLQPPTPEDPS